MFWLKGPSHDENRILCVIVKYYCVITEEGRDEMRRRDGRRIGYRREG